MRIAVGVHSLGALAGALAACSLATNFDGLSGGRELVDASTDGTVGSNDAAREPDVTTADSMATSDAGDAACAVTPRDFCTSVPKLMGVQIVDGVGDEFCAIGPSVLVAAQAAFTVPSPPPPLPEIVRARWAWSQAGLHLHAHVDDPAILVVAPGMGVPIWDRDCVEVFVAGWSPLSGAGDLGAMQIEVAPPSPDGGVASQALVYVLPSDGGAASESPLAAQYWVARLVPGGYEVEVLLPWTLLGRASAPSAGAPVALDLGVNVSDHPGAGLELTSWYAVRAVASATTCTGQAVPPCDDRTWCTPTLE